MCEQCKAIDKRIEHYREMATHVIDQPELACSSQSLSQIKKAPPSGADLAAAARGLLRQFGPVTRQATAHHLNLPVRLSDALMGFVA
jgi:hypothetical protein